MMTMIVHEPNLYFANMIPELFIIANVRAGKSNAQSLGTGAVLHIVPEQVYLQGYRLSPIMLGSYAIGFILEDTLL